MNPTTIDTNAGRTFDFANPSADQINLDDIAQALANTCRWGGHVKRPISVAEHAVTVHRLVSRLTNNRHIQLAALHHDSHEAYVGDLPGPAKSALGVAWTEFVRPIDEAIAEWLGIDVSLFSDPLVKHADKTVLGWEAARLKDSGGAWWKGEWVQVDPKDVPAWAVRCLTPAGARISFKNCHLPAVTGLR